MKKATKMYGVADRAWQPVIGCDPHMPCAPRCWARKTTARIVECQKPQHPERAALFQIALTPDGRQWSGKTFLDGAHLTDPLKWRGSALIATGFHGDWGRLDYDDAIRMIAVMVRAERHRFLTLTKQPGELLEYLGREGVEVFVAEEVETTKLEEGMGLDGWYAPPLECWPPRNISIGCSVMNQAEADRMREAMAALAARGWNTHVWYEPAIGPVAWGGWEFLRGVIMGYESGAKSRPGHPIWAQNTRDWCAHHGIPFHFKQWGDWVEVNEHDDGLTHVHGTDERELPVGPRSAFVSAEGEIVRRDRDMREGVPYHWMTRVGKDRAGRVLDGLTHDAIPEVRA